MKIKIKFSFAECAAIEIVLVSLIVIFTILRRSNLISICFALSFIVLLLYAIERATLKRYEVCPILLVTVAVVNVLINGLSSSESNMGFDYFKKVIMFSAFILMLYFSSEDEVTTRSIRIIEWAPVGCALLLVGSFFVLGNTSKYGGGITLGFSNPNFTGMWLLHFSVYTFLFIVKQKGKIILQLFSFGLFVLLIWLIIQTKARSCLIGLALFILLCVVGKISKAKIVRNKIFIAAIILAPFILVIFYHYLLNAQWVQRAFASFVSAGKGLDSRLEVWDPAVKRLEHSFFLGDYSGISNGTGTSQLHNTHLDVICSYGLCPFLLFLWTLYTVCVKMRDRISTYSCYCALCGFLSIIIMGSFEAAVVAGAMGMNILTAGLLILANEEENRP